MEERNRKPHHHPLLYSWLAVILFSSLLVAISLPRMKQAFQESGMLDLIKTHVEAKASGSGDSGRSMAIVFPIPKAETGAYDFASYPVTSQGKLFHHEVVEHLLSGPPEAALRDGAITFIPAGTRLIGLTVSNQIAFVDLSEAFVEPSAWDPDLNLRVSQLKRTLMQEQSIRDVVVLVEGTPL